MGGDDGLVDGCGLGCSEGGGLMESAMVMVLGVLL